MLELRDITKKFNNIPVVRNVSFTIEPGEIVGYLGANGAGKTTTVKMLAGLLEPNSGSIHFNGKDIDQDPVAYKSRVGYIPEQEELYTHLSGLEYLQLVGRLRQIPEERMNRKIAGLLDQLGLGLEMHLAISSYSKGMKQKVAIAAALLHNPDILLLDEPLSGLDVTTTLVLKDLLTRLAMMGKLILYSSHILEVVEKLCTRIIVIDKGKIAADDSVLNLRQLMRLPSLESIFKELVQHEDTGKRAESIISLMA